MRERERERERMNELLSFVVCELSLKNDADDRRVETTEPGD
jgi:hypothetical protein